MTLCGDPPSRRRCRLPRRSRQTEHFLHVPDPQPMQALEDRILAFVLFEIVDAEDSFPFCGERSGLLLAEEVVFLAETGEAAGGAAV